ncbi:hybrid sensor histidine kinase/response regulator [Oceanisphaera pacifica]|uniref:histidine kinase n=1 Tax=Oceanisphaera pacifica TaxID=2818389 RepID=A0ABS3NDT4_9GAMM|nr:response regulator [Oceanisphaera pacifica]MBO1518753.1 response regulator [Oceanisphaera pacifica]
MTAVAKQQNTFTPSWAVWGFACILIVLLAYAGSQYRHYRYYLALEQQITPIVSRLHQLQHKMLVTSENDQVLKKQMVELSLASSHFLHFIHQSPQTKNRLSALSELLEGYQKRLYTLQDAEMRSRYALEAFSNQIKTLEMTQDKAKLYQTLLQLSQVYFKSNNPYFLYILDESAERLLSRLTDEQQGTLYFYRIYRKSLELLVQQRFTLTIDDGSELMSRQEKWRQQSAHSLHHLFFALFLTLMLCFGSALVLLVLRNRKLRKTSQTALTLARTKTDFLANMSHEIRTPMNAIIGFASLMQQTPLTPVQQQHLKKIKLSSDNLLLLINDILDLTKVEAGKLELEDIEFDLNEQLERLSGLFSDMSENKQLEVVMIKDPEVPNSLRGDPLRLGQVLVNLVNNAVKFTERGEVVLKVSICHNPEPQLCFAVSDTGIGIVPEQLDRLFQSFTQVDASTTRKYGGSGLGLSITHHLVQLMQGTIEVTSQPGLGSCFTVSLPLNPGQLTRSPIAVSFKNQAVLLVDDNHLVIEVVSQLLTKLNMTVYSATNLTLAKDILLKRGSAIDIAIIDCRIGPDDGLDLARYLQQESHFRHIKLLITSAFGQDKPAQKMRNLGLTQYLSKPITEHNLRYALQQLLEVASADTDPYLLDVSYYQQRLLGKHVLLAEDNRMNQQLIVEFLKQIKVSVTLADNGRQAVELTSKHSFDAILMDLQMPILDGVEATRQIRKLNVNHQIPIIALTASAMRGDRETSLAAGMNSYVTKPVNRFGLYQALIQELATVEPTDNKQISPAPANTRASSESELTKQHQFAQEHQDDVWLLQAHMAADNWSAAQQLINTLVAEAQACGLFLLAEQAQTLLAPLAQQQRPPDEHTSQLTQSLTQLK